MPSNFRFFLVLFVSGVLLYALGGFLLAKIVLMQTGNGPHGYGSVILVFFPMAMVPAGALIAALGSILITDNNYKKGFLGLGIGFFATIALYALFLLLRYGL